MGKIKGIWIVIAGYSILGIALIYTRFVNLSWGLPFPFHPDERNMAAALQQLGCKEFSKISECFNPHFFAYGQFPLYVGYILGLLGRFGGLTFENAVLILRFISAAASVITVLVMVKVVGFFLFNSKFKVQNAKLQFKSQNLLLLTSLIFIFSPGLIQFAHFGTTESLLMLFYSLLVYLSLLLINKSITVGKFILFSAIICGLAVGTKVSSAVFIGVPLISFFIAGNKNIAGTIKNILALLVLTALVGLISSPHNVISFNEFIGSIRYESAIALGQIEVFYTRQFFETVPVLFQFMKIFPYALGWPVLIIFILGFFMLPFKKNYNILRLAFLIYFIPNAFLFTKWTRFMAPIFTLMLIIVTLFLMHMYSWLIITIKNSKLKVKSSKFLILSFNFAFLIFNFALIFPGIAYLSVYRNEDVRVTASRWIYNNIPAGSRIISEGGNVVDLPLQNANYTNISFDFYSLDQNPASFNQLIGFLSSSDYVIIPSRRVFANHDKKNYPLVNEYYENLTGGKYGFKKIKEFSSYPKISVFNKTLFQYEDENAEETWSVFDHPVIRIYQKLQ